MRTIVTPTTTRSPDGSLSAWKVSPRGEPRKLLVTPSLASHGGGVKPPCGRPVRRKALPAIDTARDFGDGLASNGQHASTAYVSARRDRRVRRGQSFMRRCIVAFLLSLLGVARSPQYSNAYYGSWCLTMFSFFFMLPSVLPTDNTKIRRASWVAVANMSAGAVFAAYMLSRKLAASAGPLRLWNIIFWSGHVALAATNAVECHRAAKRFAPVPLLNSLWVYFGWYFQLVSAVGYLDVAAEYSAGLFEPPSKKNLRGKLVVVTVQLVVGRLCHCSRFKIKMWAYAASIGHVVHRRDDGDDGDIQNTTSRGGRRTLERWLRAFRVFVANTNIFQTVGPASSSCSSLASSENNGKGQQTTPSRQKKMGTSPCRSPAATTTTTPSRQQTAATTHSRPQNATATTPSR